jgi:hypothetical protein
MITIRAFDNETIQIGSSDKQVDYLMLDIWRKAKDLNLSMSIDPSHIEYVPVAFVPTVLEPLYCFTSQNDTKENLAIECVYIVFYDETGVMQEEFILLNSLSEEQSEALKEVIDYDTA